MNDGFVTPQSYNFIRCVTYKKRVLHKFFFFFKKRKHRKTALNTYFKVHQRLYISVKNDPLLFPFLESPMSLG